MGIRINKSIGYFITHKEAKKLFVKNYLDIFEELDSDDEKEQEFFNSLISLMESYNNEEYRIFDIQDYKEAIQNKKIHSYELVSELFFYDTSKGVFFKTLEQVKLRRHDDLIDYYENTIECKIKYLNRPIYPIMGYVYQGGLPNATDLKVGQCISGQEASRFVRQYTGAKLSNNPEADFRQTVKDKFFTPSGDPVIYMIAKSANILKEGITYQEFSKFVLPAIATTWG